jgi:acetate---CoA ligase (ADP-forming)
MFSQSFEGGTTMTGPACAALGIASPPELTRAHTALAARLGPRAAVCEMAAPGQEVIIGMARDQALGPLIATGAGGVLANYFSERTVAPLHVTPPAAGAMISRP